MSRRVLGVLVCTMLVLVGATVWVPGEYGEWTVEPVPKAVAAEVRERFAGMRELSPYERDLAECRWWGEYARANGTWVEGLDWDFRHDLGIESDWSWMWNAGPLDVGNAFDGDDGLVDFAGVWWWRVRWPVVGIELGLVLGVGGLLAVAFRVIERRALAAHHS